MVLKKVQRGDNLLIPASTYNAFIDAAHAHQQSLQNIGKSPENSSSSETILIKNNSGVDAGRFAVLGVSGVVIDPTVNLDTFKNYPALTGVTPVAGTHEGKFVITQEPINSGKFGKARLAGLSVVQINVQNTSDTQADIDPGQTARLKSGAGTAQIIYTESGTGIKWALVRLGTGSVQAVYGWYSNHAISGQYNCRLMAWNNGSWSTASSSQVVCKVTKETSGHAFGSGDLFLAIGAADVNGVVPVIPLFYAYAK